MDFERLETVMRTLALEAGDVIMEIYNSEDFDVRAKSDDSPVTAADEAADALISAGLRAAFPPGCAFGDRRTGRQPQRAGQRIPDRGSPWTARKNSFTAVAISP